MLLHKTQAKSRAAAWKTAEPEREGADAPVVGAAGRHRRLPGGPRPCRLRQCPRLPGDRPHAEVRIVQQLGCEQSPGVGLQCDYQLAFTANGRPATTVIRGVNPSDVSGPPGNRHLDIYYDRADPSKAGDLSNDAINNVFVILAGVAVLAIVSTVYVKRHAPWRELRAERRGS